MSDAERIAAFLDLVDCDPADVRDTCMAAVETARKRALVSDQPHQKLGKFAVSPMPFGKHKGTPIWQVPKSYLQWLASTPDDPRLVTKNSRRFKTRLREFLKQPGTRAPK